MDSIKVKVLPQVQNMFNAKCRHAKARSAPNIRPRDGVLSERMNRCDTKTIWLHELIDLILQQVIGPKFASITKLIVWQVNKMKEKKNKSYNKGGKKKYVD